MLYNENHSITIIIYSNKMYMITTQSQFIFGILSEINPSNCLFIEKITDGK